MVCTNHRRIHSRDSRSQEINYFLARTPEFETADYVNEEEDSKEEEVDDNEAATEDEEDNEEEEAEEDKDDQHVVTCCHSKNRPKGIG
eukprot:jgi/Psemu1/50039/gm1.50039_g